MENITNEFWETFKQRIPYSNYFDYYHNTVATSDTVLKEFLYSTLDEVRLRMANKYSKIALEKIDIHDAEFFRRGILRREVSSIISYQKQRDHSAHTLNNYLFGWYFYLKVPIIENKIREHFELRNWNRQSQDFANIWPFTSLVHDIGYLFEGFLSPLDPSVQNEQVNLGIDVVQDYFNHIFWIECGTDSIYDRNIICNLANISEPKFTTRSMMEVADNLRNLGSLENLRLRVNTDFQKRNIGSNEQNCINSINGLQGDTFDLWIKHYQFYGNNRMVEKIKYVRSCFEHMLSEGLNSTGLRLLDHGVSSGLLMLLYSTFYFRTYFGLLSAQTTNEDENRIRDKFINTVGSNISYEAYWWWTSVVWATAATAIHNIQQLEYNFPESFGDFSKLNIDDDPLAYLGILVDILQEWDRYTVSRESSIGGSLPIQGKDVLLGTDNNRIQIDYQNSDIKEKVIESLDHSLEDWNRYVVVV